MMNLKNKILIAIMFALGTILWSCDSLIYDNLEDCPQGVYVKFYSMTPCETDSSFIGEVPSLWVFAFDSDDKLVVTANEKNVNLSKDYELLVPVSNGTYSFIGWAGIDDNFDVESFTPGSTTKKDVMLHTKQSGGVVANLLNSNVWQGESRSVFLPDPAEFATFYEHVAINLRELTNKVNVTLTFSEVVQKEFDTSKFFVEVESQSGTYRINGTMPVEQQSLEFPIINNTVYEQDSITWNFAMMDLQPKQGNLLNIYYLNDGDREERVVFKNDLVGAILVASEDNPGKINLACENEFNIRFHVKGACENCPDSYFACDIYINDWKVHSYEMEL